MGGGEGAIPPPPEEEEFAAPPPPEEEEYAAPPPPEEEEEMVSKPASTYRVRSGDSLWRISGKSSIYDNHFKWPLLYKANKSIIEDPDLIYPRQTFEVRKNWTRFEVEDAVQKAKETPPYEPHTMPRKRLPVRY